MNRLLALATCTLFPWTGTADDAVADLDAPSRQPAWFIELPSSVDDILVADASQATMYHFVREGDRLVEKDQRYMSIGLNGIGKQRAWDRRTPLGIYFITESLDTSRLHDKYGVAAYPLDYPNAWDRHQQRTGSGIWLHGVDHNNPERPPRDTDGCLSLPNEEIARLEGVLEPLVTPVVVVREMAWADAAELEANRIAFRMALDTWRESLAAGDLGTYLTLYAEDFRYRGLDREEWSSYRLGVFERRKLQGVKIEDLALVADPEVPGLYLARFTQVLDNGSGLVSTTKRLYWRRDGDRWEIVAEDAA